MTGDLYLGVDLGTSSLKLGVFDASGAELAAGRATYDLQSGRPGWAEQSADDWWRAFEAAMGQARAGVDLARVRAVCVVAQSPTIVPIDGAGRALRPALTWADRRATAEAAWLGEKIGTPVRVEFEALPRIMWLKRNEPDVYARTAAFLQAYDYLQFRLTGSAMTAYPHPRLRQWTPERVVAAELDPAKFPETAVPPGVIVGEVAPSVADRLGLARGCAVVSGTVDAFAHWLGADATVTGRLCNVGGTSEGVSLCWPEPLPDPRFRVFGIPSPFGSGWLVGGSMSNGGSALDWALAAWHPGTGLAAALEAVATVPPGSEGLVMLPYLLGERTPVYSADARGALVGLGSKHRGQHVTRAVLEGVAFGIRSVIGVLEELGASVDSLVTTGGTARVGVWNQIKADVTRRPVTVPKVKDSGVMGAAILARAAATGASLTEVARELVRFERTYEPQQGSAAVYDDVYAVFQGLYPALTQTFGDLAELRPRLP